MNSEFHDTPIFGNKLNNFYNSCSKYTPVKINNDLQYNSFNLFPANENNPRYALKYPETRLFTESKRNKLNDMKKNVCDRMMDRIINHRRERMDNILYFKSSIIENCKNEYFDKIGYFDDNEFNHYVNQFFSEESLSLYFDQIASFINNNEIDTPNFEACVFQNKRLSFCPFCGDLVFLTKSNLLCSLNCFNFITNYDKIMNLDQLMTCFNNFLKEHPNCDRKEFELIEYEDQMDFCCKLCI